MSIGMLLISVELFIMLCILLFIPGNLAQKFIDEHDEVLIERIGGRMGRSKGDIPCVRFQVIAVNDQPLQRLVEGKIEKGRR